MVEFFIELPAGAPRDSVTLGGGTLSIHDGVKLVGATTGFSSAASVVSQVRTEVGVSAELLHLWSQSDVWLRSNARVRGNLTTQGELTLQQGARVDGTTRHHTSLQPLQRFSWLVAFPGGSLPSLTVEANQQQTLSPGHYGDTIVRGGARLILAPGLYSFANLNVDGTMELDNRQHPVLVYVKGTLLPNGQFSERDATRNNTLIGVAGTTPINLQRPFRGILVAPYAAVSLPTSATGHTLSVWAKSITAHQNTTIRHRPFKPENLCDSSSGLCHGLCPCDDGAGPCLADSDCQAELACGEDNGSRYGTSGIRVCWPQCCEIDPVGVACAAGECGENPQCAGVLVEDFNDCTFDDCATDGTPNHTSKPPGFPCVAGSCDGDGHCIATGTTGGRGQPPNPDATCLANLVVGVGNGAFFATDPRANLCWDPRCELQANDFCHNLDTLCGLCPRPDLPVALSGCSPNCDAKVCGDDPSDGCGGICVLCGQGEAGCTDDAECGSELRCAHGAGERYGYAAGTNVCWPYACERLDQDQIPCGSVSAPCGLCPQCVPACNGKDCGADGCGGECGQCGTDEFCGAEFQCAPNTTRFDGEIPAGIFDPTTYETEAAGTLPGTFKVSNTGQARYDIPLTVPPGRAGMEPRLTLTYDSGRGDGLMGQGWALSGLPTIEACTKTIAQDGFAAGLSPIQIPGRDLSTRYCLGGNRLVLVNAQAHEYRTELDTIQKILITEFSTETETPTPKRFKVFQRDGQIVTLRRTHVTTPGLWIPEKVEDHAGNYMIIEHEEREFVCALTTYSSGFGITCPFNAVPSQLPKSTVLPSRIWYSGHSTGKAPDTLVEFNYEARPDVRETMRAGSYLLSDRLLSSIDVKLGSNLLRRYEFDYTQLHSAGTSVLQTLKECVNESSSPASTCKPATRFEYDSRVPGLSQPVPIGFHPSDPGQASFETQSDIVLDMDGDGVDDLLMVVLDRRPTNKNDVTKHFEILFGGVVRRNTGVAADFLSSLNQRLYNVIDYDADGRDDLLMEGLTVGTYKVLTFKNGSFQVVDTGIGSAIVDAPIGVVTARSYVLDADGDGIRDLVRCRGTTSGPWEWTLIRMPEMAERPIAFNGYCTHHHLAFSVDGGAAQQLLMRTYYRDASGVLHNAEKYTGLAFSNAGAGASGSVIVTPFLTGVPAKTGVWGLVLDPNGDGLLDIVVVDPAHLFNSHFGVYPSRGTPLGRGVPGSFGSDDPYFDDHLAYVSPEGPTQQWAPGPILDVNGDGRDDILVTKFDEPEWRVLTGKLRSETYNEDPGGTFQGFRLEQLPAPAPQSRWADGGEILSGLYPAGRPIAMDVNGDGLKDFVQKREATWAPVTLEAHVQTGPLGAKLVAVTNGFGARTDIQYEPLSKPRFVPNSEDPLLQFFAVREPYTGTGDVATCAASLGLQCKALRNSVVSMHWVYQGPEEFPWFAREFMHEYEGARLGLNGRGFLGFGRHTMLEPARNASIAELFDNTSRDEQSGLFPFAHRVKERVESVSVDDGTRAIEHIKRRSALLDVRRSDASPKVLFPFEQTITNLVEESDGSAMEVLGAVVSVQDVDQFNNVVYRSTEWTGPGAGEVRELDIEYAHETRPQLVENWLISLPYRRTWTSSDVADSTQGSHSRVVETNFADDGVLRSSIVQPDDADLRVGIEFFPNAYGMPETVLTTGKEVARTASIAYDQQRQVFPFLIVDAEDYESEVRFDHASGTPWRVTRRGAGSTAPGLESFVIRDGFGRIRVSKEPDGRESSTSYEPGSDGLRVVAKASGGPLIATDYDVLGRPIRRFEQIFGGDELAQYIRYTVFGGIFDVTLPATSEAAPDPFAIVTSFTHDARGRVLTVTEADGAVRQACYDGFVTCGVDAGGYVQCTESDARGRVRFVGDPVAANGSDCAQIAEAFRETPVGGRQGLHYIHGPFGVAESVNHVQSGLTLVNIISDSLGRATIRHDAGIGETSYTYTSFGRTETITDAERALSFEYDDLDRLLYRYDCANRASCTTEWAWRRDMPDRLDFSLAADGTRTSYGYDELGRANSLQRIIGGEVLGLEVEQWDDVSRPRIIRYPGGAEPFRVENVYDSTSGVLEAVHTVPAGGSTDEPSTLWQLESLTGFGEVERESFNDGETITERTYHPRTRLPHTIVTSSEEGTMQDLTYTYDARRNLESRTDAARDVDETFTYDQFGRIRERFEDGTVRDDFQYTELGSLFTNDSEVTSGAEWTYHYENDRPHAVRRISRGGSQSVFEYSASGNLLHRGEGVLPELNVDYTSANKPSRIWSSDEASATIYGYDADQFKVSKTTSTSSTLYLGDLYQRIEQQGTALQHRYIISNGTRAVAQVVREGTSGQSDVLSLHDDYLGSIHVIGGNGGVPRDTRRYATFGSPGELSLTDLGFTGHRHELEHDLVDMRGRMYDPRVGQFLSGDPFIDIEHGNGAFNRYSYVLNNPFRFTDPFGFQACDELGGGCGQGGGGVSGMSGEGGGEGLGSVEVSFPVSTSQVDSSVEVLESRVDEEEVEQVDLASAPQWQGLALLTEGPEVRGAIYRLELFNEAVSWTLINSTAAIPIVGGGSAVRTATQGAEMIAAARGATPIVEEVAAAGVQVNRAAGNAFRDEIARALQSAGREVQTEVYKATPFGKRFIDIQVSQSGRVLGGVETKLGGSPYTPAQRSKDAWLWLTERYPVSVVREP